MSKSQEEKEEKLKDSKLCKCACFILSLLLFATAIAIIILSFIAVLHVPAMAPIYSRLMTAGVLLLFQALFAMIGVIACRCCCICCTSVSGFKRTFISSFSVGFELFFFGGMYLFWNGFWRNASILNGNCCLIDYGFSNDIDTLLDVCFSCGITTAALCIGGFVVLIPSGLIAMYLLPTQSYISSLGDVSLLMCSAISADYLFIGSWLSATTVYSDFFQGFFLAFLTIGGVCSAVCMIIDILKYCSCCTKCMAIAVVLRILVYVALFTGAFIAVFSVYPQRLEHVDMLSARWEGCKRREHLEVLMQLHSMVNVDTNLTCSDIQQKVERVYYCGVTGINNREYCDDAAATTIDLLVSTGDGYGKVFAFDGTMTIVFLFFSIVFWIVDILANKYCFNNNDNEKLLSDSQLQTETYHGFFWV